MSAPLALQKNQLLAERYRLARRLGFGAIGEVWAARNEPTGREVAIKVVRPRARAHAGSVEALEAFERGVRESGKLRHPCIVEILDLLRVEDAPAVVLPLLDAEKLGAALARRGRLEVGASLRLVGELARALAFAHEQGVVHGRVAPANVLLSRDARGQITPILVDFGVARFVDPRHAPSAETATSLEMFGELAFLSPEQAAFEREIDGRSDVWALGVLLQQCIVGEAPFRARRLVDLRAEHAKPSKPLAELAPQLDPEVGELCRLALIRARASRISARELAARIEALLRRVPGDWPELAPDLRLAERLDAHGAATPRPPTTTLATPKPAPVTAIAITPLPSAAVERTPAPPPPPAAPAPARAPAPPAAASAFFASPTSTPAPVPAPMPAIAPPAPARVEPAPAIAAAAPVRIAPVLPPAVPPVLSPALAPASPPAWTPLDLPSSALEDADPEEEWARAQRSAGRRRVLGVIAVVLAIAAAVTLLVLKQLQDAEPKAAPASTGEPLKMLPAPH